MSLYIKTDSRSVAQWWSAYNLILNIRTLKMHFLKLKIMKMSAKYVQRNNKENLLKTILGENNF